MSAYIEQRDGGYYFVSSRMSLDSVVYQFLQGESPESIAQAFPSLSLEQVYGGLTFYLAHRQAIDEYLAKGEAKFAELSKQAHQATTWLSTGTSGELKDADLRCRAAIQLPTFSPRHSFHPTFRRRHS